MRPNAKLAALAVWMVVFVSIAVLYLFWQIGYLRPHGYWAVLCLLALLIPLCGLCWFVLYGPSFRHAVGWLLIGLTPLIWIGSYFGYVVTLATSRAPMVVDTPMRISAIAGSTAFDLLSRCQYPRWIHGQHAVLMDNGKTPNAKHLVGEMDQHLQSMAQLLGQSVPNYKFPWVRGSLFGLNERAVILWALCGDNNHPDHLTHLDHHEMAHTLITALAGIEHEPPVVLVEGWAESQSSDRDDQIYDLSRKRKKGSAYTLQELVNPYWYGKSSRPVYWQGGPLVHFLMETYSPQKFFELYQGVRRRTFHEDCQAILGESWQEVENKFWPWIDAEAQKIVQAGTLELAKESPPPSLKFAPEVNPDDWHDFMAGCQGARSDRHQLPRNIAFQVDYYRTITDKKTELENEQFQSEFQAEFEENNFWIFENFSRNANRYLSIQDDLTVDLWQGDHAKLNGDLEGRDSKKRAQREAKNLMNIFFGFVDPAQLLPFPNSTRSGQFLITSIERPQQQHTDPWSISYTFHSHKDGVFTVVKIKVDPTLDWSITHFHRELEDVRTTIAETQYQRINDTLIPKTIVTKNTSDTGEVITKATCRPLTDREKLDLRKRIERAIAAVPTPSNQNLLKYLGIISILCPLFGILCLLPSRRLSKTSQDTAPEIIENNNHPSNNA